jgi:hypothetical protein
MDGARGVFFKAKLAPAGVLKNWPQVCHILLAKL